MARVLSRSTGPTNARPLDAEASLGSGVFETAILRKREASLFIV